jgi:hypothetical protein
MQTVISNIALSFVDDAIALASGFVRICRDLISDAIDAVAVRLFAPIERLARRCDVAGVLPSRRRGRFDVFGFGALHDLT